MTPKLPATTQPQLPANLPRIGLTLGGGGARGLAHILVLEVFEELGLRPALISGTSIGALFGAAYASGLSPAYIRSLTEETLSARFDLIRQLFSARTPPLQKIFSVLPMRSALLDSDALLEFVLPKQMAPRFDQLAIPMRIVATDLSAREAVVLASGDLRQAIAASIAIPVLFSPVVIDGRTMADGGIVNPLPYDVIADDVDLTVAIDVSGAASEAVIGPKPSMVSVLTQSVQILQKTIIRERLRHVRPDVYIDVDLDEFGALQFHKVKTILETAAPLKDRLKTQLMRVLTSQRVASERVTGQRVD